VEVLLIRRETERAFLVYVEDNRIGGPRLEWLPKSAIADTSDYRPGDWYCVMEVRGWLVEEKRLA